MPKKSSEKKKVTARRQETEAPRQPARRQNPFELVLPSELADLASTRNIQVAQVRQPPTTQSLPPTTQQNSYDCMSWCMTVVLLTELANLASARNIQVA